MNKIFEKQLTLLGRSCNLIKLKLMIFVVFYAGVQFVLVSLVTLRFFAID